MKSDLAIPHGWLEVQISVQEKRVKIWYLPSAHPLLLQNRSCFFEHAVSWRFSSPATVPGELLFILQNPVNTSLPRQPML